MPSSRREFMKAAALTGALAVSGRLLEGEAGAATPPIDKDLDGVIEMHVHADPDVRARCIDQLTLTRQCKQNGYRVYSAADLNRLAIIRALRAANYSLAAILRLLDALDRDATADIGHVLDHPDPDDDILSVCDRLLTSLDAAERNAFEMIELLERMKKLA